MEIEFTHIVDEIEVAGCLITADLRLVFSGSEPNFPVTLESVRTLAGERVPTFVWDACKMWTDANQPKLMALLTEALLDREDAQQAA